MNSESCSKLEAIAFAEELFVLQNEAPGICNRSVFRDCGENLAVTCRCGSYKSLCDGRYENSRESRGHWRRERRV
jgi:hypothetical protein